MFLFHCEQYSKTVTHTSRPREVWYRMKFSLKISFIIIFTTMSPVWIFCISLSSNLSVYNDSLSQWQILNKIHRTNCHNLPQSLLVAFWKSLNNLASSEYASIVVIHVIWNLKSNVRCQYQGWSLFLLTSTKSNFKDNKISGRCNMAITKT